MRISRIEGRRISAIAYALDVNRRAAHILDAMGAVGHTASAYWLRSLPCFSDGRWLNSTGHTADSFKESGAGLPLASTR